MLCCSAAISAGLRYPDHVTLPSLVSRCASSGGSWAADELLPLLLALSLPFCLLLLDPLAPRPPVFSCCSFTDARLDLGLPVVGRAGPTSQDSLHAVGKLAFRSCSPTLHHSFYTSLDTHPTSCEPCSSFLCSATADPRLSRPAPSLQVRAYLPRYLCCSARRRWRAPHSSRDHDRRSLDCHPYHIHQRWTHFHRDSFRRSYRPPHLVLGPHWHHRRPLERRC